MATMQDVADLAKVSRATVSIIVNGQQNKRHIPEETCQKVYKAMAQLQYHPNVAAKRLRGKNENLPIIALYWPDGFRINYMARFIRGILTRVRICGYHCELAIQTYKSGELEDHSDAICSGNYSAAIISGTTAADIRFLEQTRLPVSVVLINRDSAYYHSVSCNNYKLAEDCAHLFAQSGHRDIAMLSATPNHLSTDIRSALFINAADKYGLVIKNAFYTQTTDSIRDAVAAAEQYLALKERPHAIYCDSDYIALGFAKACNQAGLSTPKDYEIISVGMLDPDFTEYSTPSITTASIPVEAIAADSIDIAMESLKSKQQAPVKHIHDVDILYRDSFHPRDYS